jgi:hypothetical protein
VGVGIGGGSGADGVTMERLSDARVEAEALRTRMARPKDDSRFIAIG